MKPDDILIIAFIVIGLIISAINKLFQEAKRRSRPFERPKDVTDWHEDDVRTARRRSAAPPPAAPTGAPEIEDVIRRLMGVERDEPQEGPGGSRSEAGEDEWQPVPPPIVRRSPRQQPASKQKPVMPRQMYEAPQPRPVRPRQQGQQAARPTVNLPPRPVPSAAQRPPQIPQVRRDEEELLPEDLERREQERRWREEMERRRKQQAAQQAQLAQRGTPEVKHSHARLRPTRRRLIHDKTELRRALILNEILGPPRAFRDLGDNQV